MEATGRSTGKKGQKRSCSPAAPSGSKWGNGGKSAAKKTREEDVSPQKMGTRQTRSHPVTRIGQLPVHQPSTTGRKDAPISANYRSPGLVTAGRSDNVSLSGVHVPMMLGQASGSIGESDQLSVLSSLSSTLLQLVSNISKVVPQTGVSDGSAAAASVWSPNLSKVSDKFNAQMDTAFSSQLQQSNILSHKVPECSGKEAMP